MSTQLLISAAGAAVGFAVAGPLGVTAMQGAQLGFLAGSLVSSVAFPPEGQSVEGARLQDLKMGGSSYGVPIPLLFGHPRVKGEIVWASEKHEIATTTAQESGGGKGGGSSSTSTTYTYTIDLLILLSDAPGHFPSRIWNNGKLIWTNRATASDSSVAASAGTTWWTRLTSYTGEAAQLPDATYEADVGTANACAYRGRSTIFIEGLDCGSGGNVPNLTFEMTTVPSRVRCTYRDHDAAYIGSTASPERIAFGNTLVNVDVVSYGSPDYWIVATAFDISSPDNMVFLGHTKIVATANNIVAEVIHLFKLNSTRAILYTGQYSNDTLYLLDMTVPTQPVVLSSLALVSAEGVIPFQIDNENIAVPSDTEPVVDIYRVVGSSIVWRSRCSLPARAWNGIYCNGYIYTAWGYVLDPHEVYRFDVTDLDNPGGPVVFSTGFVAGHEQRGRMSTSGNRFTIQTEDPSPLADSSSWLTNVYDASIPASPTVVTSVKGAHGFTSLIRNGTTLVVENPYWMLYDVESHPAIPLLENPIRYDEPWITYNLWNATYDEERNLLWGSGDAGNTMMYGLQWTGAAAFEGQSTDLLETVGTTTEGSDNYGNVVRSGTFLYYAGREEGRTVTAVDVASYGALSENDPSVAAPEDNTTPSYVAVSGSNLFTSNSNMDAIYRYSLAAPAEPVVVNSTALAYTPRMMAVSGAYLWVVSSVGQLTSYATAASPLVESGTATQATTASFTLLINGNYAYINNYDDSRISIFDISNPLAPVWSSYLTTAAFPTEMVISDGYMYLCCRGSAIQVYSIASPALPVLVGTSSQISSYINAYASRLVSLRGATMDTVTVADVYDTSLGGGAIALIASDTYNGFEPAIPLDEDYVFLGHNKAGYGEVKLLTPVPTAEPRLMDVVSTLCERAGLSGSQFDVLELASITQPVRAMAITQVSSARSVLQMLMASFMFEAVLSDKIYFRPRGQASVEDIPFVDLVGDSDPLPISVGNELEYPAQVSITYADVLTDYQEDTQRSDRLLTGQVNNRVISVPLGMRPAEAKQLADKLVFDGAVSKVSTRFALPLSYARLEPSDVVQVTAEDGYVHRMRITSKRETNGYLDFSAVADDATALSQSDLTSGGAQTQEVVYAPAGTQLRLMDIPILRDQDDTPGYYLAVASASTQWQSGSVFASKDGVAYTLAETLTAKTIFGMVEYQSLDDAVEGAWEPHSEMVVSFTGDVIPSTTTFDELVVSKETNLMLVGDEIVQFLEVTPAFDYADYVALGLYYVRGFIRGLKGTPTTEHINGEAITVLQMAGMRYRVIDSSQLGVLQFNKGVTSGQRVGDVGAMSITPVQATECLAPINARANRATTDTVITWTRQTRLSTRLFSSLGISAPLGETTESYDIEVYTTAGRTVLKRTFAAQTSETVTYTSAQQVTDFGSNQTVLYLRIYQNSEIGGRGNYLDATI